MTDKRSCSKCGTEFSSEAAQGLCPRCLLDAGLKSEIPSPPVLAAAETCPPTNAASASFPTPHLESLARQFPQLEILEFLGRGGMGVVYKARQRQLNRLVAVKILPPRVGEEPAFAERFMREAQALARLNHSHIVQVYDFGQTDEFYYFVMEFVDGVNLRALIREGKLQSKEALKIVPQICEALQFAHDEGIVHRDVKPENILIDKKGRVKIPDFGLAKLLDNAAEDLSLTGTGQLMGTLGYMAPEQLQQARAVDHRADIYSLGVVFYEMLTGQLPIGRFEPPSKKVQVDVRLDEIVLRSLESEASRRYQHARDVKTDVETIAGKRSCAGEVGSRRQTTRNVAGAEPTDVRASGRLRFWKVLAVLAGLWVLGSTVNASRVPEVIKISVLVLFTLGVVGWLISLFMRELPPRERHSLAELPSAQLAAAVLARVRVRKWQWLSAVFALLFAVWLSIMPSAGIYFMPGPTRGVLIVLGPMLALGSLMALSMLVNSVRMKYSLVAILLLVVMTGLVVLLTGSAKNREFAARIDSARSISTANTREQALKSVALDAATAGESEIAMRAIGCISLGETKDVTAGQCAVKLAELGRRTEADDIVRMIAHVETRNETLRKIAELK